ncbi:MAG: phenylacetate--CoA ligase family protein [Planctomycetes bacterium]|nr:phenylacetate--CoA ligase family protein [Planctomycetota bacterium]
MNPWLVRTVLFPAHERLKGHGTGAALREARRWDRMSADELAAAQLAKLRRLVEHAARHVPYYREAFARAGVGPGDLGRPEDLARFPTLTRADLRRRRRDLVATDRRRRMAALATGGSTGEPVTVLVDARRAAVNTAARIRAREWWGIRMGEREAVLWASPIELTAQDRLRRLRDRLLNSRLYSAFEGSPEGLEAIAHALARFRPQVLYGYSSSLSLLARHLLDRGSPVERLAVRAVFATAEGLAAEQRDALGRAFRAAVGGEYGARDAGLIAHECPAGGHHILAEGMFVEVLAPDGTPVRPGARGEIVTTHLEAFGFPLVRYRTGDVGIAAAGPCACGRALPRLAAVEGRATDFLLALDGRLVHALGAIYVLRVLPGIAAFRVEQPAAHRVVVRAVREEGFPAGGEETIREGMCRLLGAGLEVAVEWVAALAPSASGKHRHVVSPVAERAFRGADAEPPP